MPVSLFENGNTENSRCVFCRIINNQEEGYIIYEDNISIILLDTTPLFPGHCLLMPKKHKETLADLDSRIISPLFKNAQMAEKVIEDELNSEGTFIAINNRISQSIPHLHIHIVPRNKNDGLKGFFWPRHPYKDKSAIISMQERLKSAITKRHELPPLTLT